MEWNVVYHNINKDKIEIYNIFKHGGFREEVKSHLKECENKEEFENKLKRSLMHYFWSKCEWETVITSFPPRITTIELDELNAKREEVFKEHNREPYSLYVKPNVYKKIDVYEQVMNNWDVFLDMVWNSKMSTPECHWTSKNAYPFCFGAKYPHNFAENDCNTCPWYSEYWRVCKMQEISKLKELDMKN